MPEKPSYLGLLNAIAAAESRAHQYLSCWIATTSDPDVKAVLATVAAREGEHGMSFAKRVNELGFTVREKADEKFDKQMAIASSCDLSDLEKMEKLGLATLGESDGRPGLFDDVFKDHSIDIRTGELLGRYIAEEYDTARLLRCCYDQLRSRPPSASASVSNQVADLGDKVDLLCRAVDELRQIVCAQTMPAATP